LSMSPAVDLFCWLWSMGALVAGDPSVILPAAVSNSAEADVDYPFQGEYLGASTPEACPCRYGLQVAALGEGKFEALLHEGGLPGNGGSGLSAFRLKGERATSSFLRMEGGGWAAEITDGKTAQLAALSGGLMIALFSKTERSSPTLGAKPPAHAVVLFDGSTPSQLTNAELTEDGLLKVGAETTAKYRDFSMHAEFRTPYLPQARGQARGNSGFYLQRRYEVQVLDSFGQWPMNNEAGSLYKFKPPEINMSYPPLVWQTYDIDFTAARFDGLGNRIRQALITVRHNGVTIHDRLTLYNKTGGGKPEGPDALPILFQNHGNPVHYRNLWLVEKN
ncbi:MAG: DUF1080 domain-containing protein, partial [Pirellulales bacterium]